MKTLTLACTWQLDGPLHVGTGLSRSGYADRLIRRDFANRSFIPGDAVKGAIRMSAERLLRWLVPECEAEEDDKSFPTHPVLRRLFQPVDSGVYYRFEPARDWSQKNEPYRISTTAIDRDSHTARGTTLRTIEASSRLSEFGVRVVGEGGEWLETGSRDWHDGCFLAAALVAADAIGAKRGVGYGRLLIRDFLATGCADLADLGSAETVKALQRYLQDEARLEQF